MAETGTEDGAAPEPVPDAPARRRRGGRPRSTAAKRRAHSVSIKLTPREWAEVGALADKAGVGVCLYVRARALRRPPKPRQVRDRRAPALLAAAATLASLARELRELAEADGKGEPSPATLSRLGDEAHAAGVRLIEAASDAA